MPNYGDINYWENRYMDQKETTFDWLEDFETLKSIFNEIISSVNEVNRKMNIPSSLNVLNVGCGNSELSEHLFKEMDIKNIFNIDTSTNVIKSMREKVRDLHWEVMDARDLKYGNSNFDIVIDKAMMDSVLCGDNPYLNVILMTKEIQRVLKTGGVYLLISHGEPESRMTHLMREHLQFEISVQCLKKSFIISNPNETFPNLIMNIPEEKVHYVYVCKKKPGADSVSNENFASLYYKFEGGDCIDEEEDLVVKEEELRLSQYNFN